MRFVRHLTAVVAVVAIIAGLGLAWAHVSGGSDGRPVPAPVAGPPPGSQAAALLALRSKERALAAGSGFRNYADLVRTVLVEAAIIGVVSTSGGHRRRRRQRRLWRA